MNGRALAIALVASLSLLAISLPAEATTQCPPGTRGAGDTGLMWLGGLSVVGVAAGVTGGLMASRADTTEARVGWGVGGAVVGVGAIIAAVWIFSHYVLSCRRVVMALPPLPNVRSEPGWNSGALDSTSDSTRLTWSFSW